VSRPAEADHSRLNLVGKATLRADQPAEIQVRPSLQSGAVDEVEFGILLKKWYGLDVVAGTFLVDAVITARWRDRRTVSLIPSNASSLRLSAKEAEGKVWLPDITVTNLAHSGADTISVSILLEKSGSVTQVQRALLTIQQAYEIEDFPFDSHDIQIKVASAVYMRSEVTLMASTNATLMGAPSEIFTASPWTFVNTSATSVIEKDGLLEKSRGILTIRVKRITTQYLSDVFVPTLILLILIWCSLWFPLDAAYVMPRVAISVISVLCMMSESQRAGHLIPSTSVSTWMGQYLEISLELQFLVMIFNALVLSLEHRSGDKTDLASTLDVEVIFAYPIVLSVVLVTMYFSYFVTSRLVIVLCMVFFLINASIRYRRTHSHFSMGHASTI
jgi:hypothetical protein